jgi:hypothetical protein
MSKVLRQFLWVYLPYMCSKRYLTNWCAGPTCHAEWLAPASLTDVLTQLRSSALSRLRPTCHHQHHRFCHITIITVYADTHAGHYSAPNTPINVAPLLRCRSRRSPTRERQAPARLQLRGTTRVDVQPWSPKNIMCISRNLINPGKVIISTWPCEPPIGEAALSNPS